MAGEAIQFFILSATALCIYLFPSMIAGKRDHHAFTGIFLINILVGWTVIGWIVCLIWAYSRVEKKPVKTKAIKTAPSLSEELEKLGEMKEKGLISEDEFKQGKEKILAR